MLATMYSNKKDSMTISVQIYMWHKTTITEALLDSGATHRPNPHKYETRSSQL
jgi:hypothetical protein